MGLEIHKLLSRDDAGVWSLGPGLAKLAAHASDSLAEAASTVLPRLREITEESVQVYRREGTAGSAWPRPSRPRDCATPSRSARSSP